MNGNVYKTMHIIFVMSTTGILALQKSWAKLFKTLFPHFHLMTLLRNYTTSIMKWTKTVNSDDWVGCDPDRFVFWVKCNVKKCKMSSAISIPSVLCHYSSSHYSVLVQQCECWRKKVTNIFVISWWGLPLIFFFHIKLTIFA